MRRSKMAEYEIVVTFRITVEAEDEEEAENWGYDWTPKHPQTGESVEVETCNVVS
jgi:hypothetical protein